MEHFYKYITSKKFDLDKMSKSTVTVTLKVDGTPFQIVFQNDTFSFRKRSKDEKTEGEEITRMDAFTNPAYFPIMKQIAPILKNDISKFNGVHILNTEILVDNEYHVIQYNQKPKGNLCVLNGQTINNKSISSKMIQTYANVLGVESVPVIFSGVLDNRLKTIVDFVKKYCDPHNPKETGKKFKDEIQNLLGVSIDSVLMDTRDGNVEGFVFDFEMDGSHTLLKIDDPSFVNHGIEARNQGMSDEDANKMETVLKEIYDFFSKNKFPFKKVEISDFEGILNNFEIARNQDSTLAQFLYEKGKSCILSDMLFSNEVGMLPKKFQKYKDDEKFLYALRIFVWLFGKKQSGKHFPILSKFEEFMK